MISLAPTNVRVGGDDGYSFKIISESGGSVTLTPERDEQIILDDSFIFRVYDGRGTIVDEPRIPRHEDSVDDIPLSVSGDTSLFEPDPIFEGYTVELLDGGDVLTSTDERIYGIGYDGRLSWDETTGDITATFPRDEEVKDEWTVELHIINYDSNYSINVQVVSEFEHKNNIFETTYDANAVDSVPDGGFRDYDVLFFIGNDTPPPNLWAFGGQEPDSGGDVSDKSFDPTVHGFGFKNWATDPSNTKFTPPHDHSRISKEEATEAVGEWNREIEGFDISHRAADSLATDVYHAVNKGSATAGHCLGMVYAAQQYFKNPDSLPVDVDSADDIKEPTGDYAPVGQDIDRYHNEQQIDADVWWSPRILKAPKEIAPIDYQKQLDRITTAIDAGETIPLALGDSFKMTGHVVLAYDYEETGTGTRVQVYDPKFRASEYPDQLSIIGFDESGENVTAQSSRGYERVLTLPESTEAHPGLFLAEGLTTDLASVFQLLFSRVMRFEIRSPASLTVECPDGAILTQGPDEYVSETATTAEERRVRYGAPPGEYQVSLDGEADGDYTLQVQGGTPDGEFLDEEIKGSIEPDSTHVFNAIAPENGDNGSLQPSNEAASQAMQSDSDDGGGTEMIAAGAASVVGTLAAVVGWLKLRDRGSGK
jgi:hypothetical protein